MFVEVNKKRGGGGGDISVLSVKKGELSISVKEWDSVLTEELTEAFLEEPLVLEVAERGPLGGKGVRSLKKDEARSR